MRLRRLFILAVLFSLFAVGAVAEYPQYCPLFHHVLQDSQVYLSRGFVASDLDGDGDVDLTAGWFPPAVLFNRGNGLFSQHELMDDGVYGDEVTGGDFDGDGIQDLAFVVGFGTSVTVLFNKGLGEFGPVVDIPVGKDCRRIRSGDLDGDGWLDLAVLNRDPGCVKLIRNLGARSFDSPTTISVGHYAREFLLTDLNGDSRPDLVVSKGDSRGFDPMNNTISVYMNRGTGEFDAPRVILSRYGYIGLSAADLDQDGDQDVVVADKEFLLILSNDGDGGFAEAVEYDPGSHVGEAVAADFDGDGDMDLAAPCNTTTASIVLLLRGDEGTYSPGAVIPHTDYAWGLAAVDLDGDGDVDLAAGGGGGVRVLFNTGPGVFHAAESAVRVPMNTRVQTNSLRDILRDFDGDNRLDLVLPCSTPFAFILGTHRIVLWRNEGNGSLHASGDVSIEGGVGYMVAAELNGDSACDLAVLGGKPRKVIPLINRGDGSFVQRIGWDLPTTATERLLIAGHFNNDDHEDLAVFYVESRYQYLEILLSDGNGGLTSSDVLRLGYYQTYYDVVTGGDLDNDSDTDLVLFTPSLNRLMVYGCLGNGRFAPTWSLRDPSWTTMSLTSGDFDGDGDVDIGGMDFLAPSRFYVWPNEGGLTLGSPIVSTLLPFDGQAEWRLHPADFNLDGSLDIMIPMTYARVYKGAAILQNLGGGRFAPVRFYYTNDKPSAVGDLDGDGDPDILSLPYGPTISWNLFKKECFCVPHGGMVFY